ncbi:MAG: ABC transporter permease [Bacteroidales bacterium]
MDLWIEIWDTIKRNKLRTFFTGFSVAWGIFMLIVLLAAGNGLRNGITKNYEDSSTNFIRLFPGYTSFSYGGHEKGRAIKLDEKDIELLESNTTNVEKVSPSYRKYGLNAVYGSQNAVVSIEGLNPESKKINGINIQPGGRFINNIDIQKNRRVAVIHQKVKENLFRNENPIGKQIIVGKLPFQVVGVYSLNSSRNESNIFIPLNTALAIFPGNNGFNNLTVELKALESREGNEQFVDKLRILLGRLHTFDPSDKSSVWIWNALDNYLRTLGMLNGITLFIWIIGIGSLIAGIVGISNIMLITVKERTREIGIRKSLGATPNSILKMILLEALSITAVFGYMGLFTGILLTEIISGIMAAGSKASGSQGMTIFDNPTVDLKVVFLASLVIISAGLIAGFIPAKRAININPIEALRYE